MTDRQVLAELRKWLKTGAQWVHLAVLEQILGVPERDLVPALARLRGAGLAEHEARSGVKGGAWRAVTTAKGRG